MNPLPTASPLVEETARLASLYRYDVLPSVRERVFDELVELSAQLFGLPICYVLLLDEDYGHYKALHGLAALPAQARHTLPCAQVIRQNSLVVYHDLTTTPHAPYEAPAIQRALAHQVRFYAGAPLRMPDQQVIGTLCLVDQRPREFTATEQRTLENLAGVVSQAIVLRHWCRTASPGGEADWQQRCQQAGEEVQALGALIRYLLTRYGQTVPVAEPVLHQVGRRVAELLALLTLVSPPN